MNSSSWLLGPDEPAPFTVQNSAGQAPMMIACDHASNRVPRRLAMLGLAPELLKLHIAYDIGAQQVATELSRRLDAPLLAANYSRLVLDLNRYYDDPGMFAECSDHCPVPGNQGLCEEQKLARYDALFQPYHAQHRRMVEKLKRRFVAPIILSVHSFTKQMNGVQRPWHFGVLWDQDRDLAERLRAGFELESQRHTKPLVIGDNQPYLASNPQGYSLVEHAAKLGVEMALIEIRQDLIADAAGQQWAADILYRVIQAELQTATR